MKDSPLPVNIESQDHSPRGECTLISVDNQKISFLRDLSVSLAKYVGYNSHIISAKQDKRMFRMVMIKLYILHILSILYEDRGPYILFSLFYFGKQKRRFGKDE